MRRRHGEAALGRRPPVMTARRRTAAAAGSALVFFQAFSEVAAVPCPKGEAVLAYFASGKVVEYSSYGGYGSAYDYWNSAFWAGVAYAYGSDYGPEYGEGEDCTPEMYECYRDAVVSSGPDSSGRYTVDWEDGDDRDRLVPAAQVKRASDEETCDTTAEATKKTSGASTAQTKKDSKPKAAPKEAPVPNFDDDEEWTPPEIPCTIMPRLHWEGSDPAWNKDAVEALRKKYDPDELIDGFDWHVILRFNDADRCEKTYKSLEAVLNKCKEPDPENCRTHKYVKAIEYVGDDPDTRRKTGRKYHKDAKKKKDEL
eukprot:TRINITY_DN91560_c0_g1_i1.p1 TRINITY_DN91560_c0_g1~~TRINITY_DN91560_c0_g1_i1.p1  ORF type:complete len:312 (-),score=70.15 TRINITY_DN91560_c0_g1_i1:129-1064(-)